MAIKKKPAKPLKKQKKLLKKGAAQPLRKAAKPAARKPVAPKPAARSAAASAGKSAAKSSAKPAAAPARSTRRASWLDEKSHKPVIERHARQLRSFMDAMADGRIDESELAQQEQRLIELMREIEPQLDDRQHAQVTELLCELTAYDLMQTLYSINANRPKPVFQG